MSKSLTARVYVVQTAADRPLRLKKLSKSGVWKNLETGERSSVQSYIIVGRVEAAFEPDADLETETEAVVETPDTEV